MQVSLDFLAVFVIIYIVVSVLGENFLKYMDAFKPFLLLALKNHAEYQVC